MDAALADEDYHPEVNPRVKSALGIADERSVRLLVIVNLGSDLMTVNLRAPLVVNLANGTGSQVILENRELPLRARVMVRK